MSRIEDNESDSSAAWGSRVFLITLFSMGTLLYLGKLIAGVEFWISLLYFFGGLCGLWMFGVFSYIRRFAIRAVQLVRKWSYEQASQGSGKPGDN